AYVEPAKLLAMTALDLMHGDALVCREIAGQQAPLTKAQYLNLMERTFAKKHSDYSKANS
ncbi:MAG: hypothetical protein ABIJ53_03730, partial [Verrucomicrobiota bacterium]